MEILLNLDVFVLGKNKGKRLDVKSVRNFLNSIINQVKERFLTSKNPKTIVFLQCLSSHDTSEQANWLRGVHKNIWRRYFQRSMKTGGKIDHSVSPIYHFHISECVKSYSLVSSRESAQRKFTLICSRQAAGRSSEVTWILFESLQWDPSFQQMLCSVCVCIISVP